MPLIRAQKDLRRAAALGDFLACFLDTGGFRFMPARLADARPLRFRPPDGDLPALRVQAGDLAIEQPFAVSVLTVVGKQLFARLMNIAAVYPAGVAAGVAL